MPAFAACRDRRTHQRIYKIFILVAFSASRTLMRFGRILMAGRSQDLARDTKDKRMAHRPAPRLHFENNSRSDGR
jgi:hypothetical protein